MGLRNRGCIESKPPVCPNNEPSKRLLERVGFRQEGYARATSISMVNGETTCCSPCLKPIRNRCARPPQNRAPFGRPFAQPARMCQFRAYKARNPGFQLAPFFLPLTLQGAFRFKARRAVVSCFGSGNERARASYCTGRARLTGGARVARLDLEATARLIIDIAKEPGRPTGPYYFSSVNGEVLARRRLDPISRG